MLNEKDNALLKEKGIHENIIYQQIENFRKGFPALPVVKAATINDGIIKLDPDELVKFSRDLDKKIKSLEVMKFVPASGAASRMFKHVFAYINDEKADNLTTEKELKDAGYQDIFKLINEIENFAFFDSLKKMLQQKGLEIKKLLAEKHYKTIVRHIVTEEGLNYGKLPKALIFFHKYTDKTRTSLEEHLVEGARYAQDNQRNVHLHFTVSPQHMALFDNHILKVKQEYEEKFNVKYNISFSIQKPSTDTLAVNLNNEPFRNEDGSLLFRPGGHGALIENLNEMNYDLIFIKNIDNVVPDGQKKTTYTYKKALAGLLLTYREKIFTYLRELDENQYKISRDRLDEMGIFLQQVLCIYPPEKFKPRSKSEIIDYLYRKFNRPIRICGMVKNEGEPGGGPFWAINPDGSISLQIAEKSQLDLNDDTSRHALESATHFNPVDLVCCTKNYKGNKFDLHKFVDPQTGFISKKSKDGKELKALELPGLWNGSMADWITIFVEVPIETFNPVKTINDLLRPQHQPQTSTAASTNK